MSKSKRTKSKFFQSDYSVVLQLILASLDFSSALKLFFDYETNLNVTTSNSTIKDDSFIPSELNSSVVYNNLINSHFLIHTRIFYYSNYKNIKQLTQMKKEIALTSRKFILFSNFFANTCIRVECKYLRLFLICFIF